ncbi:hypothetical protein [Hydrogenophaga sp.]|uniref:hypothetical protein n=1 Tax=Hydrogenophaga sp. TaxID=1904254 RepID=UPI003F72224B
MTHPAPSDSERASFEAWYESNAMPCEADWFARDPSDPDEYKHADTAAAWEGWRARASLPAPTGWQMVPVEPTPEMCRALFRNLIHADDEARVIKAVLSAAPSQDEGKTK